MALQGCVSTRMCEPERSMDGLERALERHDRGDVPNRPHVSSYEALAERRRRSWLFRDL